MESSAAYMAMDRCQALARGEVLPDRSSGAVLFADISGYTPLTQALMAKLGPKPGAELLTRRINDIGPTISHGDIRIAIVVYIPHG